VFNLANIFFQFKQFTIHQEQAALKVSTDSCLFGAWIANEVRVMRYEVRNVLDIGAGTGLLMLMLAQQCEAVIDGIEMDEPSCKDAQGNIQESPWNKRLNLLLGDAREYVFTKKYDLIISNPPFYESDLKSGSKNRNVAMHDDGLKLDELLKIVDENLTADGLFAVLLPYHRSDKFIADAEQMHLHLLKRVDVRQTVNHSFFRSLLMLNRKKSEAEKHLMAIKDEANEYTDAFVELLKSYYLYL